MAAKALGPLRSRNLNRVAWMSDQRDPVYFVDGGHSAGSHSVRSCLAWRAGGSVKACPQALPPPG